MVADPNLLTLQTIDNLQEFAAYLEDQAGGRTSSEFLPPHARRCKEALLTITILLPKLRTLDLDREVTASSRRLCMNCD